MSAQIRCLREYVRERSNENLCDFLDSISGNIPEIGARLGVILDILLCLHGIYRPGEELIEECRNSLYMTVVDWHGFERHKNISIYIPEMIDFISYDEMLKYVRRVFKQARYIEMSMVFHGDVVWEDRAEKQRKSQEKKIRDMIENARKRTEEKSTDDVLGDIIEDMKEAKKELEIKFISE